MGQISWVSGGFLLTLVPRSGDVTITATVDGVSATLRHLFSPEDCIRAETRGLAVAASYVRPDTTSTRGILSVLVRVPDTSIAVNARHLQDWLCLKAIWIDQPDFGPFGTDRQPGARDSKPATSSPSPPFGSAQTETLVRLEAGRCALSCDVGPAIGKWSVTADDFAMRVCLRPSSTRDVTIGLGGIRVVGQGRAGGVVSLAGLKFSTRLRDDQCMGGDKLSATDLVRRRSLSLQGAPVLTNLRYSSTLRSNSARSTQPSNTTSTGYSYLPRIPCASASETIGRKRAPRTPSCNSAFRSRRARSNSSRRPRPCRSCSASRAAPRPCSMRRARPQRPL